MRDGKSARSEAPNDTLRLDCAASLSSAGRPGAGDPPAWDLSSNPCTELLLPRGSSAAWLARGAANAFAAVRPRGSELGWYTAGSGTTWLIGTLSSLPGPRLGTKFAALLEVWEG